MKQATVVSCMFVRDRRRSRGIVGGQLIQLTRAADRRNSLPRCTHTRTCPAGRPPAALCDASAPLSYPVLTTVSQIILASVAHILQVRNVGLLSQHAVDLLVLRYRFIECRCSSPHKYFEQTVGAAYPITPMHQKGALRNAATHQSVHPIRVPICFSLGPTRLDGVRNCH